MPKDSLNEELDSFENNQQKPRSIRELGIKRPKKGEPRRRQHEWQMERTKETKFASSIGLWALGIIVVIFLFFVISGLFAGATISVSPKSESIVVDRTLTLTQEASAESDLSYELMTVREESSKTVPSEGQEFEETVASGQIKVFNNHTEEPTELVANTRFESPDGKIYRIREAIVIPGKTSEGPGVIETTVFADEAGEEYNIGLVKFTVPGLQGTPEFENYGAESVTPMTGGFSGTRNTVSENTRSEVEEELSSALETALLEKAQSELPEGYIVLPGTEEITYTLESGAGGDNQVVLTLKGTLVAAVVNESDLAHALLDEELEGDDEVDLEIANVEDLEISLVDGEDEAEETLMVNIEGNAEVVWEVDLEALKQDLLGVKKSHLEEVLANYDSVREASVSLRPFWKRTIPSNEKDVTIELAESEE